MRRLLSPRPPVNLVVVLMLALLAALDAHSPVQAALSASVASASGAIASWTDAPGQCPAGAQRVDLRTGDELADASRGQGAFAANGPGTCYYLRNGTYRSTQRGLMLVRHGGAQGRPLTFVGESRAGVVLHGYAWIEPNHDHIVVRNLTFDIASGNFPPGSFSTFTTEQDDDILISHVTFTGDCRHGMSGGHVDVMRTGHFTLEDSLVEQFGHCASGPRDQGVYLESGHDIVIHNNLIRRNASRGIQLYTQAGDYGTLDRITIDHNRISQNGHGEFQDGIYIDGADKGSITNVAISNNVIDDNDYAGIRFNGPATASIVISHNTLYQNGVRAHGQDRSQINVDDGGVGAQATIMDNIVVGGPSLLNRCARPDDRFVLRQNVVFAVYQVAQSPCVISVLAIDPQLVDPAHDDFRVANPKVAGYGADAT